MKVNIKYVILFFTLLCAAVALHMVKEKKERISTLKQDEKSFAIRDTTLADRIVIKHANGNKLVLAKKAGNWLINDTLPADESIVARLLLVFAGLKIDRPVAESIKDSLVAALPKTAANVTVFGAGKEIKNYLIGVNTPDYKSNYFSLAGSGEVFAVSLPGYTADLQEIFSPEPDMWKDRTLLALTPYGIEEISLTNVAEPGRSFSIVYENDFFNVRGLPAIDTNSVMTYLSFFSGIKASGFVTKNDSLILAALAKAKPNFILNVKAKTESRSKTIEFYAIETGTGTTGRQVFVGNVQPGTGYVYLSRQLLFRLLRSKNDFERKEKNPGSLF